MLFVAGVLICLAGVSLASFGWRTKRSYWELPAAGTFFGVLGLYLIGDHLDGTWAIVPEAFKETTNLRTIEILINFGALVAASAAAIAVIGQLRQLKTDAEDRQKEISRVQAQDKVGEQRQKLYEGLRLLGSDKNAAQIAGLHILSEFLNRDPDKYHLTISRAVAATIRDVSAAPCRALQDAIDNKNLSLRQPTSLVFRDAMEILATVDRAELIDRHGHSHKPTFLQPYMCELLLRKEHNLDHMQLTRAVIIDVVLNGCSMRNTSLDGFAMGWIVFKSVDLRGAKIKLDGIGKRHWNSKPSRLLFRNSCKYDQNTSICGLTPIAGNGDVCLEFDDKNNEFIQIGNIPEVDILRGIKFE